MIEKWKVVPLFERYEASNIGNVRHAVTKRAKKSTLTKTGRLQINLWNGKKNVLSLVHRIILLTFIGECPAGHECNHKDGNPKNNKIENLEWVTRSQNLSHAYANNLNSQKGDQNGNAKLKEEDVINIKKLIQSGIPQAEIARRFNTPKPTINHIATGYTWRDAI
jgi:hypothetical protein